MTIEPSASPPSDAKRPRIAAAAGAALTLLHAARTALPDEAQLEWLRAAAFVPARYWELIAPGAVTARLAAAARESAAAGQAAAFWLGEGLAPWSVATYAGVHADWTHAISNAALIALCGAPVARRLSAPRFLAFLALSAILGAAAQMSALDAAFAPLVGASACVSALIGALARLWTEPGATAGECGSMRAAARRPQSMSALGAGVLVMLAGAALGDDVAAIGWRAHLAGFLMGFLSIGVMVRRRKTDGHALAGRAEPTHPSIRTKGRVIRASSRAIEREKAMTVSVILAKKGRVVATASPDVTLQEAAKTLADKKIGALVILHSDGDIAGILSERDVVRAVADKGAAALADAAVDHMTTKVITTSEDRTIISVLEEMSSRRFRHMPVVAAGKLAGILSIGDIVNHRLKEMEAEQAALRDYIAG